MATPSVSHFSEPGGECHGQLRNAAHAAKKSPPTSKNAEPPNNDNTGGLRRAMTMRSYRDRFLSEGKDSVSGLWCSFHHAYVPFHDSREALYNSAH